MPHDAAVFAVCPFWRLNDEKLHKCEVGDGGLFFSDNLKVFYRYDFRFSKLFQYLYAGVAPCPRLLGGCQGRRVAQSPDKPPVPVFTGVCAVLTK